MNVLRGVAALLSHKVPRSPLPLLKDGDLLFTIHSMLCLRGFDSVKVSKVKGHATRAVVASGDVRLEDLVGNKGADVAADLGRLRQHDDVITARRNLLRVRRLWYPIMLDFHRFMVAISRIEVNIMMVLVALLRKPWFGTKVVLLKHVLLPFVLLLNMLLFLVLQVFWIALGVLWILFQLPMKMLLLGLIVLTSFWFLLPFWPLFIGHRILPFQVSLAFPILNCS